MLLSMGLNNSMKTKKIKRRSAIWYTKQEYIKIFIRYENWEILLERYMDYKKYWYSKYIIWKLSK